MRPNCVGRSESLGGRLTRAASLCFGSVIVGVFAAVLGCPCASSASLCMTSDAPSTSLVTASAEVATPACIRAPRVSRLLGGVAEALGELSCGVCAVRLSELLGDEPASGDISRDWSAKSTDAGDSAHSHSSSDRNQCYAATAHKAKGRLALALASGVNGRLGGDGAHLPL